MKRPITNGEPQDHDSTRTWIHSDSAVPRVSAIAQHSATRKRCGDITTRDHRSHDCPIRPVGREPMPRTSRVCTPYPGDPLVTFETEGRIRSHIPGRSEPASQPNLSRPAGSRQRRVRVEKSLAHQQTGDGRHERGRPAHPAVNGRTPQGVRALRLAPRPGPSRHS